MTEIETAQAIARLQDRADFLEGSAERAFECITRLLNTVETLEANTRRSFDALKPRRGGE